MRWWRTLVFLASHVHPCWLVGDFIALVEARDVVDAGRFKIDSTMKAGVDVPAEDETRALLCNRLGQLWRAKVFGISLERSIHVASGNVRRRVRDKHVESGRNLGEPLDEPVGLTLERPRIGDDRHPRRAVESHPAYLRSRIAEEMDVRREGVFPVNADIPEEDVRNRVEVVVAGNDDELDVGI